MIKILYWIPYSLLYLFSLLPFRVIYALSDVLYVVLYYLIGYRKEVVRGNLSRSFPDKSADERLEIEKKYFHYLADNLMESIKMISLSEKSLNKRFRLVNPELVQHYFDKKQSVLLVTGHYGNWEWAAIGVTSVIKTKTIMVYKPLTNKTVETFINNIRSRYNGLLVPMKQTVKTILDHRGETYMAVFASDQTPTRHEKNHFISFLNQPTSVFLGLEKIAKLTGDVIVYLNIDCVKRGYYEAHFKVLFEKPLETKDFEITEAYNRELESIIRQKPQYWLWSHKRWKHKPPVKNAE